VFDGIITDCFKVYNTAGCPL